MLWVLTAPGPVTEWSGGPVGLIVRGFRKLQGSARGLELSRVFRPLKVLPEPCLRLR